MKNFTKLGLEKEAYYMNAISGTIQSGSEWQSDYDCADDEERESGWDMDFFEKVDALESHEDFKKEEEKEEEPGLFRPTLEGDFACLSFLSFASSAGFLHFSESLVAPNLGFVLALASGVAFFFASFREYERKVSGKEGGAFGKEIFVTLTFAIAHLASVISEVVAALTRS